jgi:drug/metabolite transporter (DMT)-like permease
MPRRRFDDETFANAVQEDSVKKLTLSLPEFFFVVATRAALGAGIGLLAAERLRSRDRHRLGTALLAVGVLTTLPAAFLILGQLASTNATQAADA